MTAPSASPAAGGAGPTAGLAALAYGGVSLAPHSFVARVGGTPVKLSAAESTVLSALLLAAGQCVNRFAIVAYVQRAGLSASRSRFVDTIISRLRSKLSAAGAPWNVIQTLHGHGYRVSAAVASAPAALDGTLITLGDRYACD